MSLWEQMNRVNARWFDRHPVIVFLGMFGVLLALLYLR